jgi:hypothetical protein
VSEQWADVFGYEGIYQVSDRGRVKRLPETRGYNHWRNDARLVRTVPERIVANNLINSGYHIVHLYARDGSRRAHLVHRLVATAFCPGADPGKEVNHLDGCKLNNAAANLEWVTRTTNHLHAVAHGLRPQAIRVRDPATGRRYYSKAQACAEIGKRGRRLPTW